MWPLLSYNNNINKGGNDMKTQKAKWVAVNYETGEVLQVGTVMTKHKALKIFTAHQRNMSGFVLKQNLKLI
jgi:hypothetical protein